LTVAIKNRPVWTTRKKGGPEQRDWTEEANR